MATKISLGLLQIRTSKNREQNLEKAENAIDELDNTPDIFITPEYLMGLKNGNPTRDLVEKNAVSVKSEFFNSLKDKAREMGVSILFTAYLKKDGYFNSSVFVNETGKIQRVYKKIHLFNAFGHKESDLFKRGEEIVVFDWKNSKIGLAMCFDLRFPELFRIMAFMGADLILVPSGFYSGIHKIEQWRSLIQSRAHENNMFVVGVNQPEPYFIGRSTVASPLGYEVGSLGKSEELKIVEVDMGEVPEARKEIPIEKLIRSNLYGGY